MQRNRLIYDTIQYKLRIMSEPELLGARALLGILAYYLRHPYFWQTGYVVDGYGLPRAMCRLYSVSGRILSDTFHRNVFE